jgi:hypothetical protein
MVKLDFIHTALTHKSIMVLTHSIFLQTLDNIEEACQNMIQNPQLILKAYIPLFNSNNITLPSVPTQKPEMYA